MSVDEFVAHLEELLNTVVDQYGGDEAQLVIRLQDDPGDRDPLRDRLSQHEPGKSCRWAVVTKDNEMRRAGDYAATSEEAVKSFWPAYLEFFKQMLPRP